MQGETLPAQVFTYNHLPPSKSFSSRIRCITVWWQEGIALPG